MSRPNILPEPVLHYEYEYSVHPDSVRFSFDDGSTAVYDIRRNMPHPLVIKNGEIMAATKKKITQGYVNQPVRRRRRKP